MLYVPQMLAATTFVVLALLVLTWALRETGVITSPWAAIALVEVLAVGASAAGAAYWRRHTDGDVVFSELLPWGWVKRIYVERKLTRAMAELHELGQSPDAGTMRQRQRLLEALAGQSTPRTRISPVTRAESAATRTPPHGRCASALATAVASGPRR